MYNPGDLIEGRYRVFAREKGGMGFVFLCDDLEWKIRDVPVKVAVKTLLPQLHRLPGASDRFYNEALLWVELGKHPNIVQAHYVKNIDGFPFIFMEFVIGHSDFGPDISGWIKNQALDISRSLHFAIGLCDGMEYARQRFAEKELNFVHRDLKPANVLVNTTGTVKLTDFGLSKVIRDTSREKTGKIRKTDLDANMDLTIVGTMMGSPKYMSPEQCKSLGDLDARSDVYSFGCMFYEMLTGQSPYQAENLQQMIDQHLHAVVTPPSRVNPELPANVDAIVLQCLEKNADARYKNFSGLRNDLTALFEEVAKMVHPSALAGTSQAATPETIDVLNKSLSLYELGKKEEGVKLFADAMGLKRDQARRPGQKGSPRRLVKGGLKNDQSRLPLTVTDSSHASKAAAKATWDDAKTVMTPKVPVGKTGKAKSKIGKKR